MRVVKKVARRNAFFFITAYSNDNNDNNLICCNRADATTILKYEEIDSMERRIESVLKIACPYLNVMINFTRW